MAQRRGVQLQGRDQLVVPLAVQRAGLGRVVDELAQVVRVVAGRRPRRPAPPPPGAGSAFASPLSATSSGRVDRMNARIGSASRVAERSGCAIAHDFGAISPTTRCTNVTTISASDEGRRRRRRPRAGPRSLNSGSSRSCTAGLATAPKPQRAERDAQLGAGEQQRQVAGAAQRGTGGGAGLRGLLQPVAGGPRPGRTRRRRRTRSARRGRPRSRSRRPGSGRS